MKKRKLKMWVKVTIVYLIGLLIIFGMCARANQINKSQNNKNYIQNK